MQAIFQPSGAEIGEAEEPRSLEEAPFAASWRAEDALTATLFALEANAFCSGLPPEDLQWLAYEISWLELEGGGIIFEDRDQADAVYLVVDGAVSFLTRVTMSADFTEVSRIPPGNFFGEGTLLERLCRNPTAQQSPVLTTQTKNSKARVVCPVPTKLMLVSSQTFAEILRRQPLQMTRNLLKHSADKSRMSSQSMFEEVINRETKIVIEGVTDWITRHTVDFLTNLQLNADVLRERALGGPSQVFVMEMADALANFRETTQALRELAGGIPAVPALTTLNLRPWMQSLEKPLRIFGRSKGLEMDFYAEDLEVVSNTSSLDRAMNYAINGVVRVAPSGSRVGIRAGRNHSLAEIHLTFTYPGLSEFIMLRLFEPFGLRGDNQDVGVCFTLTRRIFLSLGGDGFVKHRSGSHLTLAFNFPILPPGS